MKATSYAFHKPLPDMPYERAIEKTTAALKSEGFGVLTTIDVRETLRNKLAVDFRRYVILGACNPQLASEALLAEDNIGLLLPCNVVVAETANGAEVAILQPAALFGLVGNPNLNLLATDADQRLQRVLERI